MAESRSEPSANAVDPILAEYRRRLNQGEQVDREQFIAEHPEAADQLRAYFSGGEAAVGGVQDAAVPSEQPAAVQTSPPPESGGPVTHAQSLFTSETTGYPWKPVPGAPGIPAGSAGPMSVEQVASFLTSSGLMSAEKVSELLSRASSGDDSTDAARLLDELQSSGRLTPFQCEAIRRGQTAELILGNYVLMDRLGRGGMGQVFQAWHRKMERVVALKTLRPETMNSEKAVERFHREVKTAARLTHPNIVTAHDADESGGVHFLVMEHVAGSDLADHIRQHGPARVSQAANWIIQAARGLNHAHLHGIIHRDIKPGNLLLGNDGVVKVLDMGLARLEERLGDEGGAVEALTQTGDVLGTLDYMAPEQAEDTAQADARADIYSLGCTLFYLLTGRAVYGGHTAVKKLLAHREAPVPSLAGVRRDVSEQIDTLFQRMVAKNPVDRPASMAEVIAELEPFVVSPSSANEGTETFHGPLPKRSDTSVSRSGRRIAVAVGVMAVVGLTLLAGMAPFLAPTPDGSQLAEQDKPAVTAEVVESDRPANVRDTGGRWAGWPSDAPAPAIAPFDAAQARRHQEEWAEYLGVPVEFTNSIGMKFVLIPPGEFMMGLSEEEVEQLLKEAKEWQEPQWYIDRLLSEAPRHRVRITRPFYLGLYEVTQAEYEHVMGVNPSAFSAEGTEAAKVAGLDTSRHPVEMVSWNDARAFCARLSAMPAEQAAGSVYLLPTEAQWEYACRAGTTTKWNCGDDEAVIGDYAWFSANSSGRTHAVGGKKPNAFGLFDMHGNVYELCTDRYSADYYTVSPVDDPLNSTQGGNRVDRGGCWRWHAGYCRSANRHWSGSDFRVPFLGFRVALVLAEAESKQADAGAAGRKVARWPSTADPPVDEEPRLTIDTKAAASAPPWKLPPDAPAPAIAPFDTAQARKHQEEWSEYLGVPVEFTNSIGMKFMLIPPGEFMMGTSEEEVERLVRADERRRGPSSYYANRLPWESPKHPARITQAFYLGIYEVTQSEYERVMGNNPSSFAPGGDSSDQVSDLDTSHFPVENISWNDASEFCRQLSQEEHREYRLPTEAEWEYACRAESITQWYHGDSESELAEHAWYEQNSGLRTHPVGRKLANAWGLYDMHGGVMEWCADWHATGYYATSPLNDPAGPGSAAGRVIRGGSWRQNAGYSRSAYRIRMGPEDWDSIAGFRVALSLPRPEDLPEQPADSTEPEPAHVAPEISPTPNAAPPPAIAPFDAATARKHQEAWAAHLGKPREIENSIGMKFVLIPPGEFMMGSTEEEVAQLLQEANERQEPQWYIDRLPSEAPRHRVRITRPFYLGLYEVTQAEYQQVMGGNPSYFSAEGKEAAKVAGLDTSRHPVEAVSWNDAKAFCEKLSAMPDEQAAGRVYVLPTEAQWEYACRAGTTTKWSCGDDGGVLRDYAWHSGGRTYEVGQKKPNGFGLFDMHGNVWEWCADWHAADYYAVSPVYDPQGPASGSSRVRRGGGWYGTAGYCRSAYRSWSSPTYRHRYLGFRLALVPADE